MTSDIVLHEAYLKAKSDLEINIIFVTDEAKILVVRLYKALFSQFGGELKEMRHWVHARNSGTNGIPAKQIETQDGLEDVLNYLDGFSQHA